jgi:hypothetical protein
MEGGLGGKKRPGDFFAKITRTFLDTLKTTKALSALILLRYQLGRPWYLHQLEFDELLQAS